MLSELDKMLLKFFSIKDAQTPEPEKSDGDDETSYEKLWDKFKQIEANDRALKMSPLKKNHCHCDGKDSKEYVEENNIEKQKMNADMFSSLSKPAKPAKTPAQTQNEWIGNSQGTSKPPTATPTQQYGEMGLEGNFTPATPKKQQQSYKDMLTGKAPK